MDNKTISCHAFFLTLLLFYLPVVAQTPDMTDHESVEAFEYGDFKKALSLAESLLVLDSQRVDALFIAGESARQLQAFELAEIYLSRIPHESKKAR